jgi:hypothetical protein
VQTPHYDCSDGDDFLEITYRRNDPSDINPFYQLFADIDAECREGVLDIGFGDPLLEAETTWNLYEPVFER